MHLAQTYANVVRPRATGLVHGHGFLSGAFLSGPLDPEIYNFGPPALDGAQQLWVRNALTAIDQNRATLGLPQCPTWLDPNVAIQPAVACFQAGWNKGIPSIGIPAKQLRTDGSVDEDTLCALQFLATLSPALFPTKFPDPEGQFCRPSAPLPPSPAPSASAPATSPTLAHHHSGLSAPVKVGIGVAAVAAAGVLYAVTRPRKPGKR